MSKKQRWTADCHGGTEVNLVTALGFYSMFGSLDSLLNLEQKHEMVTTVSLEVFPSLQTEQKYIGKWRERSRRKRSSGTVKPIVDRRERDI